MGLLDSSVQSSIFSISTISCYGRYSVHTVDGGRYDRRISVFADIFRGLLYILYFSMDISLFANTTSQLWSDFVSTIYLDASMDDDHARQDLGCSENLLLRFFVRKLTITIYFLSGVETRGVSLHLTTSKLKSTLHLGTCGFNCQNNFQAAVCALLILNSSVCVLWDALVFVRSVVCVACVMR